MLQQESMLVKAFETRLKTIEADPNLIVLTTMDQPQLNDKDKVSQYIVYTNFKPGSKNNKPLQFSSIRHWKISIIIKITR